MHCSVQCMALCRDRETEWNVVEDHIHISDNLNVKKRTLKENLDWNRGEEIMCEGKYMKCKWLN